ncbi:MAG: hydrogenase maturation peptidase HycI [Candidatus Aminicenantes bacterium]|nr:hydrogenase maturation peptidase HycI [Candidatus Aminicenantes bacterium]
MSQPWETILEKELTQPGRVVLLGVGNVKKGDDAAGSLCLTLIHSNFHGVRSDLLILQGGTVPENATGRIRAFKPSRVIIIDAALGGHPPGTIFIFDPQDIRRDNLSTHHLPLSLLVKYFEASLECRVICLGIEPERVEAGQPVTAAVKQAIARLAERIVDILVRRPVAH